MQYRILTALAALAIAAGAPAYAQTVPTTADVPRIISYQGVLTDGGTPISDGTHRVTVTFYADEGGGSAVWQESYTTAIVGGVFAIDIGGVGKPLPAGQELARPLWVGIALDGGPVMHPLTRLTSSPYALSVPDRSIGTAKLADGAVTADKVNMPYVSEIRVNGEKVESKDGAVNIVGGSDVNVSYDRASGNVVVGKAEAGEHIGKKDGDKSNLASSNGTGSDYLWSMTGDGWIDNGTDVDPTNSDWIGTSSAGGGANFTVKVNSQQVMMYQPNGTSTPNIVGGHSSNSIAAGSYGSVIGGGGGPTGPNVIQGSQFNTISGGANNGIRHSGTILSTISGGIGNRIASNDSSATHATIGGGSANLVLGDYATVGGGLGNAAIGEESTVAGGDYNVASGAFAAMGGGHHNHALGRVSFVGGGGDIDHINPKIANVAGGAYSSVVGGFHDSASGDYAFTGGGYRNNSVGHWSAVAGGDSNRAAGQYSFIGGGRLNSNESDWSTISGGDSNVVAATSRHGFIGGGERNIILGNVNNHSVIVGGKYNHVDANTATIGGGNANTIGSLGSVIGGGSTNTIDADANYAFIGGGNQGHIHEPAIGATIGGGLENEIGAAATGGAGGSGYGSITGGWSNKIYDGAEYATVGGGAFGHISPNGDMATIVGGEFDTAQSYGQVVMGVWNQPKGNVPFRYAGGSATGYNDPILIVGNGNGNTGARSNAFEVSYNGHSTVYRNNGHGNYAVRGATYTDNVIYAWGDVSSAVVNGPAVHCSFGTASVTRKGPGWYRVELDTRLPDFSTQVNWSCMSITATIGTCLGPSESLNTNGACHTIRTSRIGTISGKRVFDVYISRINSGSCDYTDDCFSFKVTGRASN